VKGGRCEIIWVIVLTFPCMKQGEPQKIKSGELVGGPGFEVGTSKCEIQCPLGHCLWCGWLVGWLGRTVDR
jgi:hypothetical protein